MRRNKLALYLHVIWTTWDRLPFITSSIERRLYRVLEGKTREMGCTVLALDGTSNHVHLVVSFPSNVSVAVLIKQIKGASSYFVNEVLQPEVQFRWQGGYGAFTVSRWDVSKIIRYVKRQKEHHATDDLWSELEESFEEIKIKG